MCKDRATVAEVALASGSRFRIIETGAGQVLVVATSNDSHAVWRLVTALKITADLTDAEMSDIQEAGGVRKVLGTPGTAAGAS